jgi:hypothetical protein
LRLIVATAKPANDGHDGCSVLSTWPGVTRGAVQATGRPRFLLLSTLYLRMRSPKKKPTAAKLRNWRVSILRNRAEYLGTVEAADAKAAEAVAAETFKLDGERRKRLAVRAEE